MRNAATLPRQGRDIRCGACGILIARIDGGTLTVCRGGLQLTVEDGKRASFVCYRPGCGALGVVELESRREKSASE